MKYYLNIDQDDQGNAILKLYIEKKDNTLELLLESRKTNKIRRIIKILELEEGDVSIENFNRYILYQDKEDIEDTIKHKRYESIELHDGKIKLVDSLGESSYIPNKDGSLYLSENY